MNSGKPTLKPRHPQQACGMRSGIIGREIRWQGTSVAGRVLDPDYGTSEKITLANPEIEFLTPS